MSRYDEDSTRQRVREVRECERESNEMAWERYGEKKDRQKLETNLSGGGSGPNGSRGTGRSRCGRGPECGKVKRVANHAVANDLCNNDATSQGA